MRKKAVAKTTRKIQKTAKKAEQTPFRQLDHILPQEPHQVFLYETSPETLDKIIGADEYGQCLVKLRSKFNQEIQELSRRFGVEADIRVLLTLKSTL